MRKGCRMIVSRSVVAILWMCILILHLSMCGRKGNSVPHEERADPAEQLSYALSHFWDSVEFSDTTVSLDRDFMEQKFANYIALLPYFDSIQAQSSVAAMMTGASKDGEVYKMMCEIAEHYLDDPNSPMRSEELYVLFLRHIAESERCDEAQRERASHRLRQAAKNRRGSRCADFRIFDRRGVSTTLHEVIAADTTLVMFYDPDCSQCKELTGRLRESPSSSRFPILAVDVAGNRGLWDATKADLPENWRVAFALDPVDDEEIYVLPALPSFYLLAPDGTVLLKDISPSELI